MTTLLSNLIWNDKFVFYLRRDPEPLFNLSINQLRDTLKELSPKGIHICHIYIDAMIEAPDTLGRLVGEEAYAQLLAAKANGTDEMVIPEKVADTYYHIAHQHRSAWTSEVDIRPFTEQPWWND